MYFRLSLLVLTCLSSVALQGVPPAVLQQHLQSASSPFTYPLNMTTYPSKTLDAGVTVCFHGHGGDYQIGAVIVQNIRENVISFDFPDARNIEKGSAHGSIHELLPAIYVVKQCLEAGNLQSINLYGFSAGGGALINMLAVLNRHDYDQELAQIGVHEREKQRILQAVQKGYLILDCPLKSIEEIIAQRGNTEQMRAFAEMYAANRLRPIDSLKDLNGLSLTVIINFQNPDEAVRNRDDALYIERMRAVNSLGKTIVVISRDEGHVSYHPALWEAYRSLDIR